MDDHRYHYQFLLQIIVDLTMGLVEGAVDFDSKTGLPSSIKKVISRRADGDTANMSEMRMGVHTGTHLDAPSHFVQVCTQGSRPKKPYLITKSLII